MMEHDKLTGIERELVLQYLIDGNVLEISDLVVIDENGKPRYIDRDELE